MKAFCDGGSVNKVSTAYLAGNVTVEGFQLYPPFHCHPKTTVLAKTLGKTNLKLSENKKIVTQTRTPRSVNSTTRNAFCYSMQ